MNETQFTELLAVLKDIRATLAQRRTTLTHREHQLLDTLLPAIFSAYGASAFTVAELLSTPVFTELIAPLDAREVGQFFSRAAGVVCDGLEIVFTKREHGKNLWRVQESAD